MGKRVWPFLLLGLLIVPKVWGDESKHGVGNTESQSETQDTESEKETFSKIAADPKSIEELSPEEFEVLKEVTQKQWEKDPESEDVGRVIGAISYRDIKEAHENFQVAAATQAKSAIEWVNKKGKQLNEGVQGLLESAKKTAPDSESWQKIVDEAQRRVSAFHEERASADARINREPNAGRQRLFKKMDPKAVVRRQWGRKFGPAFGEFNGEQWQLDLMGVSAGFFRGVLQLKTGSFD